MKDLFEDLFMEFFGELKLQVSETQEIAATPEQVYFDYLTTMVVDGRGELPDLVNFTNKTVIERSLTKPEEEAILFTLGSWLNSLN